MNKLIHWLFAILLLGAVAIVEAQQRAKIPRIGYLAATSPSINPTRNEAFRQGLLDLGYIEGKNIVIEWRFAEGKPDRLPTPAAELVRLKVDVIVSGGSTANRAAKDATRTIPIIMSQDNDPVANGLVASLARPGGNITGLATLRSELSGKRLEVLTEIVPRLSRVAVLGSSRLFTKVYESPVTSRGRISLSSTDGPRVGLSGFPNLQPNWSTLAWISS